MPDIVLSVSENPVTFRGRYIKKKDGDPQFY
jgi:hypothetical protein